LPDVFISSHIDMLVQLLHSRHVISFFILPFLNLTFLITFLLERLFNKYWLRISLFNTQFPFPIPGLRFFICV
jgi:hypothetical protein